MVYGSQYSTQGSKRSRTSTGSTTSKMSQFKRQRQSQLVPYSRVPRNVPLSGLPKTLPVKLKYTDFINLNAGASAPAIIGFRTNGMFDPYIPVGGHQPKGFDQWMALYRHFTVLSSKIKVTPVSVAATTSMNGYMYGVTLASGSSDLAGMSTTDIMELQNSRSYKFINNYTSSANSNSPGSVTSYFNAKTEFGRNVMGAAEFHGDASGDPTEQMAFLVWVGDIQGNDPTNHDFLVEIEYIAVLSERIPLAGS